MLWGRYVKKRGSNVTQVITKHGQILTYDGTRPPSIQQLQNMPEIVSWYMGFLQQQMEDLTVHAETMGRKTEKGQSGRAIALLQAADVQNLSDPLVNLQIFLQKIGKMILHRLSEQLVSEEFSIDDEVFKVIGVKSQEDLADVIKVGEFDEIDCILTCNFLGIERTKSKECFTRHICCKPMSMIIFHCIPEEFLFLTDTVNGFNQAAREQVGKFPDNIVHFFVKKFKISIGLMLFKNGPTVFEFLSGFGLAVDNFSVLYICVSDNGWISDPFTVNF